MKYSKIILINEAIKHKGFIQNVPTIWRMMKMWRKGVYPVKSIDMILPILGIIYVVSPIDLLPGIVFPIVGAVDDLAVLSLVIPKLMKEVEKFIIWETLQKKKITTIEVEQVK